MTDRIQPAVGHARSDFHSTNSATRLDLSCDNVFEQDGHEFQFPVNQDISTLPPERRHCPWVSIVSETMDGVKCVEFSKVIQNWL